MLQFVKLVGAPGSLNFLGIATAAGLFAIYVWPRRRAVGRVWILGVFTMYVILGLPVVAGGIAARLPEWRQLAGEGTLHDVETIVVLGGDNARGRVREALRLYRTARPARIIVSGDRWLVDRLAEAGVPRPHLQRERESRTTLDQMAFVERLLAHGDPGRVALVASRLQMPRVAALARARALPVVLVASPVDEEPPAAGAAVFLPRYIALRISRDALYEHAALGYYQWRGWINSRGTRLPPT
jgi:uncharacterized SAM-binding protein YcdF (DUF218 family)